ncbi:family 43 glycosylhydrolase [Myceligenerans pegani]|uniref:Family 43 glycosylhydrolase n=1 Tax=Myceligenerans pegani TaxID=2776917 RepID=A0ABR9MZV8_9MICO|nr:family 43 glycosylhydrolase [Myceligenerans sp. TRM 65318]MBE1876931.1 family 43 glycosylhydrolase [Myceligenerans sp. TRM 65318]MBE3019202.1 family 43 glycosylhydrolase [Myceligenerans sp. TRM 65318]
MPSRSAVRLGRRPVALVAAAATALVGVILPLTTGPAPAASAAESAATVAPTAWYVLVNRNSGKALDVYDLATHDGARITQWSRHDGDNQQWQFVDSGDGWYRLKSRLSGKVLDVSERSTANGAPIIQWTDNNSTNQQFRLEDVDGHVQLIARHSGKAVEVQDASTADGGNIVQYTDWNGANQQWELVEVGSSGPGTGTYNNPVIWQDFADGDIIRVDDAYYYSASTMHYSPGAPILRSYDLVNWEYAGHSVPRLDFDSSAYDLNDGRRYVRGIWASTLNYRPSNQTYYWLGCVEFNRTYVYTASSVDGDWTKRARIDDCYYDAGLLVDDDDTMYVAYGNGDIRVAELSDDGFSEVRNQHVFSTPSGINTLEGARFYKRNGYYYIWLTKPANGQYVLRSTSPFGPYEMREVLLDLPGPIQGGGVPHQGGLVETQNGDWYYMAFVDAYPGGRMPALAPITWRDNWPVLQTVNGRWGSSYPKPSIETSRSVDPMIGQDAFAGPELGPRWEWNHNPDTNRFTVNDGLRLQTATVTNDLYNARNTLTHRIQGPSSTATIELDYSTMRDGDRAGLAMLRDSSAWIGVRRDNGATRVSMTNGLSMDGNWNTTGIGTEAASAAVSGGRIWLRATADIRPGTGRQATFSYSTDGVTFTRLGPGFTLGNSWQFFMGYRFGIFNYATSSLGGEVTVRRFDLTTP